MSKPDDIPEDVWETMGDWAEWYCNDPLRTVEETVARAILSERTKAAEIALALKPEGGGKIVDPRRDHAHRISQAIRKGGKE